MEKELCRTICCGLISFQGVRKLQSFEFNLNDVNVIPVNAENISPLIFLHIFIDFMEKESSTNFYGVFDHFSQMC